MYRVRYRQVTDVDGNGLIDSNDNQITDFEYLTVNWGTNAAIIKGLGVGNTYEFGVTAIDNSGFSGGFAVINAVQMPNDGVAPPEPLPLTGTFGSLAGNAARVTVVHNLGAAKDLDGNTIANPVNFSLPRDIDHLNVYRGTTSNFTISSNNQVGQIIARAGHIDGQIQAMGSFPTTTSGTAYYRVTAVDVAGNESDPSVSAQVTEELIDTQYVENGFITTAKIGTAQVTSANIYDLTASKITAGTITGKEIIIDTDNDDPLNPVLGTIRSDNYVTGTSGWIIKSDGSAEFRNATIRGSLNANDITTGTLDANNVTISNLTVDVADVNNLNFSSLGATSQDIIDTIADNAILNTITNGAISEAKLGNISANKITTGTLDANNVTISNLTVGTGQVTGTFSGNVINGGTINGTTINAGTITTGTLDLDNLSITGTLSAGLLDGDAVLDNLTTSNAIGVQGSGQTSVFVGNIQANRLDLVTNMDADGWTSGDDFRGNGTTVNLYRNFSSKGIRIVGGGSGAYLYTFNSGGGSNLLYNPFSDERLKENITDLSYGLDEINQLRPITYDWKDDVKPFPENTELNYGLLAQELEEVIPALVDTAPDTHTLEDEEGNETVEDLGMMVDGVFVQNTKSYNERPLLYIAIKAIQELSAKNDELESRIATLEG
jgi:hypothetical protein